ncbi:MAG: protein kinase [Chloroflexi bacterium]|nr:protein kinase [Chloroflexota bacterium]
MTTEKIGRYEIISELGRGGMATVFNANDPSFDRRVAVKVLPRTFLHDPQFRVRFEREAKMVAALEHSAIVPVYDFGEEDGQPYIVMRLMSGGSLADKLKGGKLSLEEAAQIITHLSPALDAAHAKGIIHRDLKPGNILFDQYNNAFLSDFGIARMSAGADTITGSKILGTPAYMSPEQIQGDKDIDGRSDLYSMGVMFYQMLVGNTPYQATTPAKVMMMHILEPVPDLLGAMPDLPPAVETWLEKVLAKEPDDRFSSARDMADALTDAMRGKTPLPSSSKTMVASGLKRPTTQTPPSVVLKPQAAASVAIPLPPPTSTKRRWLSISIGVAALLGIGAIAVIALVFAGLKGSGPLALLAQATATSPATVSSVVDTYTPEPTIEQLVDVPATASPSASPTATDGPPTTTLEPAATSTPDILTIGGADKIAFLNANNVWLVNVDGSDLQQLTNDGAEKSNLGWMPDGSAITYISGKCVWSVEMDSLRVDHIVCFETAEFLDTFSISPDGTRVAISLNRELYVVPYNKEQLSEARFHTDLREMSECAILSPLLTSLETIVPVKFLRWSQDGQKIAILLLSNDGGKQVDLIRFLEIQSCEYALPRIDEFPATRFTIDGYDDAPYIQNFGYDGNYLFAMVSYTRNDGFGDLYIYNTDLHRADLKINPINGKCCYRDPQFSPDGRYLIFAYQPYEAGATAQLYYIPYSSMGTGAQYEPLPLPEGLFENPREKPQPALRPSQ